MAQKMRAVRLFAQKISRCVEVDVPHIEKDTQVLIKVKYTGTCGSDVPRVNGDACHFSRMFSDMSFPELWKQSAKV